MRLKKAFSLIELMIVVVTIGILSTYGAVQFPKQLERNKFQKAVMNVKAIYNAEKRYKLKNQDDRYFPGKTGSVCNKTVIGDINNALAHFIRDGDFSYALYGKTSTCTTQGAIEYSAVAKRNNGGKCAGGTIVLTQAGGEPTIVKPVGCTW